MFAAASGVEEPFVGVFDAQFGIGGGLGKEIFNGGIGGRRAGDQQKGK